MNTIKKLTTLTLTGCLILGLASHSSAQVASVAKLARELVETLAAKGGQQAVKELAEMGGEAFAREALEKAAQEGGEKLVQKLAARTIEHGPALLKVAKSSPSRFLFAFDELTPAMQKTAAQAMTREPDLMAKLFSNVGKEALTAAAKHTGVGTQVMETLGSEGAEALTRITTDEAIQLGRLAPKLARLAEPERRTLLDMIRNGPKTILDLLEKHPRVLYTTAGVASFIAAKDQLLGNVEIVTDENGVIQSIKKPGFLERTWGQTADKFSAPLGAIIWIAGLILLGWGGVRLWGAFRVEKTKVRINEAQLAREAKNAGVQANQSPQA